ncbi:MAG: hypothetical protein JNL35_06475 [Sphingopyxis sp.]|nr:hypothetical protein [Sphingopyxis sp.]
MTKNKLAGLIAASATALALSGAAVAGEAHGAKKVGANDEVKCYGLNSCKGTSDCKTEASSCKSASGCSTAGNDCKGANACKGQGFKKVAASKCLADGGKIG